MVVVVVVVIALGVGVSVTLAVYSGSKATSNSSTSGSNSSSSSAILVTESNSTTTASSGLELRVDLKSTVLASGDAVSAQITLFNSHNQNLSLGTSSWANSTLAYWNNFDSYCGGTPLISMVGYALFQGYYSAGNISQSSTPLKVTPTLTACISDSIPSTVTFLPNSDIAALYLTNSTYDGSVPITESASTVSCVTTVPGEYNCGNDGGLFGYWNTTSLLTNQEATTGSPFFRYFYPGEYTLAARDMWNQTVYAHFQVTLASGKIENVSRVASFGSETVPLLARTTLQNSRSTSVHSQRTIIR